MADDQRGHEGGDGGKEQLHSAFEEAVDEGERRLDRSWPSLLSTGLVGGIDVGVGVFGLLLVKHQSGNDLVAALVFSFGFVALTLANSELFTENFLVPITAVVAGRSSWPAVGRLWGGTAVANLVGGYIITGIIVLGFPELQTTAIEVGRHFPEQGIGLLPFSTAVLAGIIITLMTWMEQSSSSLVGKLLAAIGAGFLLAYGELNHAIVASHEMFAALQSGAPFGYADWLAEFAWAALGNMVGGIGLVTLLRLVQVGREKLEEEKDGSDDERHHSEVEEGEPGTP